LDKDNGYKTTFWAFPLEAMYGTPNRRNALNAFITWCGLELPAYGLELSGDQSGTSPAGTTHTYNLTVTNTGNVTDLFNLAVSGNIWTTTLSNNTVTLAAGETATFTVTVTVPNDAVIGDSDAVTVTATSQNDPLVTESAVLTTTVEETPYYIYLPLVLR
jgi:VCBS repeat-containing protein